MHPFSYMKASSGQAVTDALAEDAGASILAGGTCLIDLIKLDVLQPEKLVDINKLDLDQIKVSDDHVLVGALARNSDVAFHQTIKENFPVLSQAILSGASPQVRNMATAGGNLMQRTRCYYYRNATMPCNKREPGSGCPAIDGYNRIHAILGGSKSCVAVNASDMAVALAALDAVIHIQGPDGARKVALTEFYLEPGQHPEHETALRHAELITAIEIPRSALAANSCYLKVRDRSSFAFALVSVACALEIKNGTILKARLALGGVGTRPWRCQAAEKALVGKPADTGTFRNAAQAALQGAQPLKHNGFKIELARRTVVRALSRLGGKQ